MEFQAVVLAAGRGSRFPEVAGGKPKCLLPIGSQPLLWYPLQMLEKQGFTDVIVIVLESQKSEIQSAIEKTPLKSITPEFVTIPYEDLGTADSLRFIKDRLQHDLLIVPCDIVTEANLNQVFKLYRMHDATLSCLLLPGGNDEGIIAPGPKNNHKPERDIIGIDKQTNRLVFIASASDFQDTIKIQTHLLKKHRSVSFYSKLLDTHIYVIKNWVIDFLVHEKNIATVKGELIPLVVRKQMSKQIIEVNSLSDNGEKKFIHFLKDNEVLKLNSVFNDTDNGTQRYHGDRIRCYAAVADPQCFGLRINNIASFCAANQKIKEIWPRLNAEVEPVWVSPTSQVNSTQMNDNCIVGSGAVISEKTSIKSCVIDADCQIKPKVRVNNCVLMAGSIIEEGAILEDCVIGCNAVIGKGSNLKSCLVGHNHNVLESTIKQKELLIENDRLMEI